VRLPQPEEQTQTEEPDSAPDRNGSAPAEEEATSDAPRPSQGEQKSQERMLAAAAAALPPELLTQLQLKSTGHSRVRSSGRAPTQQQVALRGRPVGSRRGDSTRGARVNIIETLRAAAPWQRARRARLKRRKGIVILRSDLRVTRFKQRAQATRIFLVDASGSASLHRLAEAKGAVELMLADCYIRRDRVALIAFRGPGAQLLLSPTRSLVRAKRGLAKLPGGGGTPLAAGMDAARNLAVSIRQRGETPLLIILTDGRPNVARDGKGSRQRAESDALDAARLLNLEKIATVLIDTAPQPRTLTARLAREMGARYMPLPHADSTTLAAAARLAFAAKPPAEDPSE